MNFCHLFAVKIVFLKLSFKHVVNITCDFCVRLNVINIYICVAYNI